MVPKLQTHRTRGLTLWQPGRRGHAAGNGEQHAAVLADAEAEALVRPLWQREILHALPGVAQWPTEGCRQGGGNVLGARILDDFCEAGELPGAHALQRGVPRLLLEALRGGG